MRIVAKTLASVSLLLLAAGIAHAGDFKVFNPQLSLPIVDDDPAEVYFSMRNDGGSDRKLVGASSPKAERIEIHQSVFEDGAETTKTLKAWEVPHGAAVFFAPGGVVLVLFGPQDMQVGEKVPIDLKFADGEKVRMEAVVGDE